MANNYKPGVTRLHEMPAPVAAEDSRYQQKLGNIDATTRTADNILSVASRNWVGILVITLIIIVVLVVFGSKIKNGISSFWALITSGFREEKKQEDISDATGETITSSDLKPAVAQAIADNLANAFRWDGDDEVEIYTQLDKIPNTNSWLLVIDKFGTRTVANGVGFWKKKTLEQAVRDKLTREERRRCYSILTSNGVNPDFIHFDI